MLFTSVVAAIIVIIGLRWTVVGHGHKLRLYPVEDAEGRAIYGFSVAH